MPNRESPSKDRQYWKILDAVIRLEVSRGHLRWKITELSRLSGIGRPLIYYYFGKSKEAILQTALQIIGDEFFGLTPERETLWKEGRLYDSILASRSLMLKAPHVSQFYFYWRSRPGEVSEYFQTLEKRYRTKLGRLLPRKNSSEIEALFAFFFGLILLPDLSEKSLQFAVDKILPQLDLPL